MEPREPPQEEKKAPNSDELRTPKRKRRFRVVKLEERIAPGCGGKYTFCCGPGQVNNYTLNGACK